MDEEAERGGGVEGEVVGVEENLKDSLRAVVEVGRRGKRVAEVNPEDKAEPGIERGGDFGRALDIDNLLQSGNGQAGIEFKIEIGCQVGEEGKVHLEDIIGPVGDEHLRHEGVAGEGFVQEELQGVSQLVAKSLDGRGGVLLEVVKEGGQRLGVIEEVVDAAAEERQRLAEKVGLGEILDDADGLPQGLHEGGEVELLEIDDVAKVAVDIDTDLGGIGGVNRIAGIGGEGYRDGGARAGIGEEGALDGYALQEDGAGTGDGDVGGKDGWIVGDGEEEALDGLRAARQDVHGEIQVHVGGAGIDEDADIAEPSGGGPGTGAEPGIEGGVEVGDLGEGVRLVGVEGILAEAKPDCGPDSQGGQRSAEGGCEDKRTVLEAGLHETGEKGGVDGGVDIRDQVGGAGVGRIGGDQEVNGRSVGQRAAGKEDLQHGGIGEDSVLGQDMVALDTSHRRFHAEGKVEIEVAGAADGQVAAADENLQRAEVVPKIEGLLLHEEAEIIPDAEGQGLGGTVVDAPGVEMVGAGGIAKGGDEVGRRGGGVHGPVKEGQELLQVAEDEGAVLVAEAVDERLVENVGKVGNRSQRGTGDEGDGGLESGRIGNFLKGHDQRLKGILDAGGGKGGKVDEVAEALWEDVRDTLEDVVVGNDNRRRDQTGEARPADGQWQDGLHAGVGLGGPLQLHGAGKAVSIGLHAGAGDVVARIAEDIIKPEADPGGGAERAVGDSRAKEPDVESGVEAAGIGTGGQLQLVDAEEKALAVGQAGTQVEPDDQGGRHAGLVGDGAAGGDFKAEQAGIDAEAQRHIGRLAVFEGNVDEDLVDDIDGIGPDAKGGLEGGVGKGDQARGDFVIPDAVALVRGEVDVGIGDLVDEIGERVDGAVRILEHVLEDRLGDEVIKNPLEADQFPNRLVGERERPVERVAFGGDDAGILEELLDAVVSIGIKPGHEAEALADGSVDGKGSELAPVGVHEQFGGIQDLQAEDGLEKDVRPVGLVDGYGGGIVGDCQGIEQVGLHLPVAHDAGVGDGILVDGVLLVQESAEDAVLEVEVGIIDLEPLEAVEFVRVGIKLPEGGSGRHGAIPRPGGGLVPVPDLVGGRDVAVEFVEVGDVVPSPLRTGEGPGTGDGLPWIGDVPDMGGGGIEGALAEVDEGLATAVRYLFSEPVGIATVCRLCPVLEIFRGVEQVQSVVEVEDPAVGELAAIGVRRGEVAGPVVKKVIGGEEALDGRDVGDNEGFRAEGVADGRADDVPVGPVDGLAGKVHPVGLVHDLGEDDLVGDVGTEIVLEGIPCLGRAPVGHRHEEEVVDLGEAAGVVRGRIGVALDVGAGNESARAVGDDVNRVRPRPVKLLPAVEGGLHPVAEIVHPEFVDVVGQAGVGQALDMAVVGAVERTGRHAPIVGRLPEGVPELVAGGVFQGDADVVIEAGQGVDLEKLGGNAALGVPGLFGPGRGKGPGNAGDDQDRALDVAGIRQLGVGTLPGRGLAGVEALQLLPGRDVAKVGFGTGQGKVVRRDGLLEDRVGGFHPLACFLTEVLAACRNRLRLDRENAVPVRLLFPVSRLQLGIGGLHLEGAGLLTAGQLQHRQSRVRR